MKRVPYLMLIWFAALIVMAASYYIPMPYQHIPEISEFDCDESYLSYSCARGPIIIATVITVFFAILCAAFSQALTRVRSGFARILLIYCVALLFLLFFGQLDYIAVAHYRAIAAGDIHGDGYLWYFHIGQLWFDMFQAGVLTFFCESARSVLNRDAPPPVGDRL